MTEKKKKNNFFFFLIRNLKFKNLYTSPFVTVFLSIFILFFEIVNFKNENFLCFLFLSKIKRIQNEIITCTEHVPFLISCFFSKSSFLA